MRRFTMTRIQTLTLILTTASAISFAQTEPSSGWRRVGDPAPGQPAAQAQQDQQNGDWRRFNTQPSQNGPAQNGPADQDPTQPVARVDEFGQQQAQPPAQQRMDRPAYGLPPQLTIPAGTFVAVRMNDALSSDRNQEGDMFTATLTQPVVVDG